jgi:predicted RNA-binding Zn ribbon-like protein
LINTTDGGEQLPDVAALDEYVSRWRIRGGTRTHDERELHAVQRLRPALRTLWQADEAAAVEQVNALLRAGRALPQLSKHDEWDWHLHAEPEDADLATRLLVEIAMAFVDVIRAGELGRLRICADPSCDNVLVDLSRNRSRRFCEAGCGNRANVQAYRKRLRAGQ